MNNSPSKTNFSSVVSKLKTINPNEKVVFCKTCVMSNQRPRVQFNDEGICGQCLYYEYKRTNLDWDKREKELEKLCDTHRSKDGSWDVIVPGSGGKDSGFVAHTLKKKYGMHPLTVTWAPATPTEIGQENLLNFVRSGFDNIMASPNGDIHQKLSKLAFTEFGDNFLPFIYGQVHFPLHIAVKYKIPLIMYGENGEIENGGSLKEYDNPLFDLTQHDYVLEKLSNHPPEYWAKSFGLEINELKQRYMPPSVEELKNLQVEEHYFSYYHNWIPEKSYEYSKKYCGFKSNPEGRSEGTFTDFASLDDKTDGFHYYMAFIKYGIARATADATKQVWNKIITRDEAVDLVHQFDAEFPAKYLKEFLDYMQMDMNSLFQTIDKFRRSIIWKKENDQWQLRHRVSKL